MRRPFLAAALLLTMLSTGMATDEIVKDNFEAQTDGQSLSDLVNWKFIAGWVKPDFGKVTVEKGNKFLRFHGDVFAKTQSNLEEKLTYRFKIRAGADEDLGGLCLRAPDGKSRYDILFTYRNGGAVHLVQDVTGTRDELIKTDGTKVGSFQEVIVVVERGTAGIKFTVSIDGAKVIEKVDTHALPLLSEAFSAGFFTFNQTNLDIDDVEFTRGR